MITPGADLEQPITERCRLDRSCSTSPASMADKLAMATGDAVWHDAIWTQMRLAGPFSVDRLPRSTPEHVVKLIAGFGYTGQRSMTVGEKATRASDQPGDGRWHEPVRRSQGWNARTGPRLEPRPNVDDSRERWRGQHRTYALPRSSASFWRTTGRPRLHLRHGTGFANRPLMGRMARGIRWLLPWTFPTKTICTDGSYRPRPSLVREALHGVRVEPGRTFVSRSERSGAACPAPTSASRS